MPTYGKMNLVKLIRILALFPLLVIGDLWGQQPVEVMPIIREKKNAISLTSFLPTLFDGNGLFDRYLGPGENIRLANRLGYGIAYQRKIRGKHGIILAVNAHGRYFASKFDRCNEGLGIVNWRQMGFFSAHYARRIWSKKRLHIDAVAGLQFRTGYERITSRCWISHDFFNKGYALNDIGLSTGIRFEYSLSNHFSLITDLCFTEFFYRHDKTRYDQYQNYAGKGSTRHFAAFHAGLSYWF